MKLIALTGGIGAGKSVVARVLSAMGYPVYDCDSRAKSIMDCDTKIHAQLGAQIDTAVVSGGMIDRKLLSEIVFSDSRKLECLNGIVHGAVVEDLKEWSRRQVSPVAFVETAILYQCEIWKMVDAVWEVSAPVETRIRRVMARSGLSRRQILERMSAQIDEPRLAHIYIYNDDEHAVLPEIRKLLAGL